MPSWRKWSRRPQTVWLRRIAFQIHLCTGVLLSLYVILLSLTGTVLVYRVELTRALDVRRPVFDPSARSLSADELRDAAARVFPDHAVVNVDTRMSRRDPIVEVVIARDGEHRRRAFNPYTGEDLGDWFPAGVRAIIWVANLHDDLLLGRQHRAVNGIGAILLTALVLAGAVIWWPGVRTWRQALTVRWRARSLRVNRDLHRASGFWLYVLILNWSLTGIYLAFPTPIAHALESVAPAAAGDGPSWADFVLQWSTRIHFGRWPNPLLKALWALVGLVPTVLAITGLVMWGNRSLRQHTKAQAAVRQTSYRKELASASIDGAVDSHMAAGVGQLVRDPQMR
jgi:uncharacterized iron-regulated membrane protein